MIDAEMAWELAEVVSQHLTRRERNKVYVAIAGGEAFWAARFLLHTAAEKDVSVGPELVDNLLRWLAAYRDDTDYLRLRDLLAQLRVEQPDQRARLAAGPQFLTVATRYNGPPPGNQQSGVRTDT